MEIVKGPDVEKTAARYMAVCELILQLREHLPADAARIEIDIHYSDGGRVKMEGRGK